MPSHRFIRVAVNDASMRSRAPGTSRRRNELLTRLWMEEEAGGTPEGNGSGEPIVRTTETGQAIDRLSGLPPDGPCARTKGRATEIYGDHWDHRNAGASKLRTIPWTQHPWTQQWMSGHHVGGHSSPGVPWRRRIVLCQGSVRQVKQVRSCRSSRSELPTCYFAPKRRVLKITIGLRCLDPASSSNQIFQSHSQKIIQLNQTPSNLAPSGTGNPDHTVWHLHGCSGHSFSKRNQTSKALEKKQVKPGQGGDAI
jgi:hypothetical protein